MQAAQVETGKAAPGPATAGGAVPPHAGEVTPQSSLVPAPGFLPGLG